MIALRNRGRRFQIHNLDHGIVCAHDCVCTEVEQRTVVVDKHTGESGIRIATKKLARSLYLAPGEEVIVDESYVSVPSIAQAIAARELVVD